MVKVMFSAIKRQQIFFIVLALIVKFSKFRAKIGKIYPEKAKNSKKIKKVIDMYI